MCITTVPPYIIPLCVCMSMRITRNFLGIGRFAYVVETEKQPKLETRMEVDP